MKIVIKILVLVICFVNTLSAQKADPTKQPAKNDLLKYCGYYTPSKKDTMMGAMFIIMKEGKLYRRLEEDSDRELIATSTNVFVYADNSKRKVEFKLNDKGKVESIILSRPDGVFVLKKVN